MPPSNSEPRKISTLHGYWYTAFYTGAGFFLASGLFGKVWEFCFPFGPVAFSDNHASRMCGLVVMAAGSFGVAMRKSIRWLKFSIFTRLFFGGLGLPVQLVTVGAPYSTMFVWALDAVPSFVLWWDLYRKGYGHWWELSRETPTPSKKNR